MLGRFRPLIIAAISQANSNGPENVGASPSPSHAHGCMEFQCLEPPEIVERVDGGMSKYEIRPIGSPEETGAFSRPMGGLATPPSLNCNGPASNGVISDVSGRSKCNPRGSRTHGTCAMRVAFAPQRDDETG